MTAGALAQSEAARAENTVLAAKLREYADLLDLQQANPFRARAYRHAADGVARLRIPVSSILAAEGRDGLDRLPGVGPGIASALAELCATGRWRQLDRLRGGAGPEALFQTLPGVGPKLAEHLADDLHLETLEDLETAAYDGRLAGMAGWGDRRVNMIRALLGQRLGRPRLQAVQAREPQPPVGLLLDIDRLYREGAAAGRLPKIAPRRFNPTGEAWLPVLHAERGAWRFTALFSNTALAHQLGRTHDWVVIYFSTGRGPEGRCTVVTETAGPLAGRRVVRGRETETPAA
ncbi:MAG TPA: helix-hairpin-helix domain-containing protein [Caulobacteraceae bacterium]|nr:helix-hairpin-helix domain-containing protein [Caulobacteraceae bacterium]